jgi:hypothetical protein
MLEQGYLFNMTGRIKEALLSNEERAQIMNRAAYDRQTLSDSNLRIKKKLRLWLEDIKDIRLILSNLPEDLTRDVLIDAYAFDLLSIVHEIMRLQKFLSISGEVDKPEEWQARGYGIIRQAEEKDIGRSLILNGHIRDLVVFAGENYISGQNPAIKARVLDRLQEDSRLSGKMMPDEGKAIEKVKNAIVKYAELQHLAELKSGNL